MERLWRAFLPAADGGAQHGSASAGRGGLPPLLAASMPPLCPDCPPSCPGSRCPVDAARPPPLPRLRAAAPCALSPACVPGPKPRERGLLGAVIRGAGWGTQADRAARGRRGPSREASRSVRRARRYPHPLPDPRVHRRAHAHAPPAARGVCPPAAARRLAKRLCVGEIRPQVRFPTPHTTPDPKSPPQEAGSESSHPPPTVPKAPNPAWAPYLSPVTSGPSSPHPPPSPPPHDGGSAPAGGAPTAFCPHQAVVAPRAETLKIPIRRVLLAWRPAPRGARPWLVSRGALRSAAYFAPPGSFGPPLTPIVMFSQVCRVSGPSAAPR
jgi:hypothetical protein